MFQALNSGPWDFSLKSVGVYTRPDNPSHQIQEVLERTNRLVSFHMIQTAQKTKKKKNWGIQRAMRSRKPHNKNQMA
jgi:hypothetical protein